jgi:hypothetical protein
MNKKFFTLMAGVFLLAGLVGNGYAQDMDKGPGVTAFPDNGNTKLYQLYFVKGSTNPNISTITGSDTTSAPYGDNLLIMKDNGDLELVEFTGYYGNGYKIGESLWCADKAPTFSGSLGVNFTFTSKGSKRQLALSPEMAVKGGTLNVNYGNLTDWSLSGTVSNLQPGLPLYSYFTAANGNKDSVLVLMYDATVGLYVAKAQYNKLMAFVYGGSANNIWGKNDMPANIKTLSHDDNILWTVLSRPAKKVLTADDFNRKLVEDDRTFRSITFSRDNKNIPSQKNPWSTYKLKAIDVSTLAMRPYHKDNFNFSTGGVSTPFTDSTWVAFYLENELTVGEDDKWLYVDTAYTTNGSVTQYLTFNFSSDKFGYSDNKEATSTTSAVLGTIPKSLIEGQYFFMLYYDIFNDALYIDAYQITHNLFPRSNSPATTDTRYKWWREVVASAASPSIDLGQVKTGIWNYQNVTNTDQRRIFRVGVVDIDAASGMQLVTLGNTNYAATYGKLGVAGCASVSSEFESIAPGLYTIQKDGAALGVPINTDSLASDSKYPVGFFTLDGINNPDYTPASQWVVQLLRPSAPGTSSIRIINREFPNIEYSSIQLKKGADSEGSAKIFKKEMFKAVPAKLASDPHLGYFWLDKQVTDVNSYAFNYFHAFDSERYLGYDKTSKRVGISKLQTQFFLTPIPTKIDDKLTYAGVDYGYRPTEAEQKAGIAQLKRVAYDVRIESKKGDPMYVDAQNVYKKGQGEKLHRVTDYGVFLIKSYHYANGKEYYALLDTNSFYGRKPEFKDPNDALQTEDASAANYVGNYQGLPDYKDNIPYRLTYTKLSIADGSTIAYANVQKESRTSAFAIGVYSVPLYRRFDGGEYFYGNGDDKTAEPFKGDSAKDANSPLFLKFHDMILKDMFLFENSYTKNAFRGDIKNSFLGIQDRIHYEEGVDKGLESDTHAPYYQFFVDTAYVKRTSDGRTKLNEGEEYTPMPQYMLAVRPIILPEGKIWVREGSDIVINSPNKPVDPNDPKWNDWKGYDVKRLVAGYYLFNAQDSINRGLDGFKGQKKDNITDDTRLAFVKGVHYGDSFYVMPDEWELTEHNVSILQREPQRLRALPWWKQHDLGKNTHYEQRWNITKKDGKVTTPVEPNRIYKDEEYKTGTATEKTVLNGKSMVFQFRLRNFEQNKNRNFFIESERKEDDNKIAPTEAKFINIHNGVPVISNEWVIYEDNEALNDAALGFNVIQETEEGKYGVPSTANETVVIDGAKIISGVNSVTILNAAGKTVTVTNVLGQAVAKTVVSSDNASISLPKGIVIVSVDGKSAKALVK